jgi:hypothetical protein
MKPIKQYVPRHMVPATMQELEAGDHPIDYQGRELPFVPGDMLVRLPAHVYVLGRVLADALYIEMED